DNTGSIFWSNQDWPNAYKAWTYYLETAGNPRLGKAAPAAVPDTIAGQLNYWRAIAAWQAKMLPESAAAFDELVTIGFNDPQAYDYAYSVAYEMKDTTRMFDYSKAGFNRFGAENPIFLQRMINYFIQTNQYDVALNMLNDAIASEPNNPAYYYSLGVLYENSDNFEQAVEQYKKASELAPADATYKFRYGNGMARLFEQHQAKGDTMSTQEYNKYFHENLRPELIKITEVLEEAYSMDEENMRDALNVLRNVYYLLNDGENLKRVENLLKY
ncbi:MAG: tetratricopeptide repeat protein, partial [Duncaniella sp.]|nr:tetratricopeptide repeat protein [Duncaniella sp.]